MKNLPKNNRKGFALMTTVIIIMSFSLIITLAFSNLVLNERQITKNFVKSLKNYYIAEAGIEDILLRNNTNIKLPVFNPSSLNIGEGTATRYVGDIIAGTREIISEGNIDGYIRKVSVVITISTIDVSFYYGAQVGDGGMEMRSNSRIKGNVFSNGDVVNLSGEFGANLNITDDIIVANNGKKIEWLWVGENATVHTCSHSDIGGTLTCVSGAPDPVTCNAGVAKKTRPNEIDPIPLPISDTQINNWKDEASCNNNPSCIYVGDYTINVGETKSLGPQQITGNLIVSNGATLIMTGTLYVTQDITTENNATIKLDSGYGSTSGVIVADGKIDINPGVVLQGSGEEGSYIMLLSTNPSLDTSSPAIDVDNNAEGAVFYTSDGLIRLRNNIKIREAAGYKIYLDNNAEVEYEVGLQNTAFSSGPSGGWKIANWKEIE
ncbi:pilus assembly PilX N-terminal domain-containing protein [Candidatus Parcubacteria bacterium]|nr:pilus assembly PilX N-terminal domain-containing protein [Candidatus Parcubacteria bacterium]